MRFANSNYQVSKVYLLVIILYFLIVQTPLFAQNSIISGCIENYKNEQLIVQDFHGSNESFIDTVKTDASGCFEINLPSDKQGQIRLLFQRRQFLDFFLLDEPVKFQADFDNLLGSINILVSEENKIYYNYLKYKVSNEYKQRSFNKLLSDTLQSEFREEVLSEINMLKQQERNSLLQLVKERPGSLVGKVLALDIIPLIPDTLDKEEGRDFMIAHFLDNLDFNDTLLIKTNALSAKIISYLSLGINNKNGYDSTVTRLSEMSLYLLYRSMVNEGMFKFIKSYLHKGFSTLGYKELVSELEGITFNCCYCNDTNKQDMLVKELKKFPRIKTLFPERRILPSKKEGGIIILALSNCDVSSKLINEVKKVKGQEPLYIIYPESDYSNNQGNTQKEVFYTSSKNVSKLQSSRPIVYFIDSNGKITYQTSSWLALKFRTYSSPAASTSTR